MYRQIRVNSAHTRFQKILFRNKDGELCDYELDTVTFGVNCEPFLAIRILQQLPQDIRGQYPLASDIISNFMYVDDVLAGTHTKRSAVLAIEELRLALESAGFPLRKWTSNERKLLQEVPKEHLISADFLELEEAIAPVRSLSIPRLELCGAVLLTELAALVISEMPPHVYETFYWTDSTIVLAWLSRPACTWTTFVANRVAKVEQCTDGSKWGHVRSEDNPADLASRAVSPQELKDSALWWRGPAWLHLKQEQCPSELWFHPKTELEQRPVKCHTVAVPSAVEILERFSAFDRALRVLAYVFRFVKSCRRKGVASSVELTAAGLSEVQERLIVLTQKNEFPAEYKVLSNKQPVPPASAISNLNPFLDGNGVLRARGRLQASEMLSYDEKHPIILPARCRFAELQVLFIHRISLNGGNQLMIRLIRFKFWIPKLKMMVNRTIHSCRVCVIHKKRLQTQLMGNLPRARSTFSRPFTHTGVDFAGPFDVKSYVATSDLTTEKFLVRSTSPKDSSPPRSSLSTPTSAPSLVRTSVSILPTAAVLIGSEQKRFDVRVLVDPSCPVSRIHVSLVKALNLTVTGVGNERLCTTEIRSKTSRMSKQLLMLVDEQMDPKVQDMFHNMTLADDRLFHPALVSAVLGADVYADLMLPGIIASQDDLPMAKNSKLGWILSGRGSLPKICKYSSCKGGRMFMPNS
ncbi:uncharacterized protein LOC122756558 [Drosophila santomea]|uniref:uncharacterized protein LOC122756558 n=1 Tax=Drosophila santomea TaxID=129105 RepID=UPI001CC9384F|nr:uncharacterized protein LOC122756558 [Drosophila santomea]